MPGYRPISYRILEPDINLPPVSEKTPKRTESHPPTSLRYLAFPHHRILLSTVKLVVPIRGINVRELLIDESVLLTTAARGGRAWRSHLLPRLSRRLHRAKGGYALTLELDLPNSFLRRLS